MTVIMCLQNSGIVGHKWSIIMTLHAYTGFGALCLTTRVEFGRKAMLHIIASFILGNVILSSSYAHLVK